MSMVEPDKTSLLHGPLLVLALGKGGSESGMLLLAAVEAQTGSEQAEDLVTFCKGEGWGEGGPWQH